MSAVAFAGLAGLQLASGYFASQNIKATAKLNKKIADMNAEYAELDAHDAKIEGYSEVARYQKVIDQTLSEQQGRLTAAGVDVTYGSAADIQNETAFIGEINKMELEKQAEESAVGYKNQARQYRVSGNLGYGRAMQQAGDVQFQSLLGAASTGIKSASRFSSGY